eukprot:2319563-Heterocapsa_arctica.AAC.1
MRTPCPDPVAWAIFACAVMKGLVADQARAGQRFRGTCLRNDLDLLRRAQTVAIPIVMFSNLPLVFRHPHVCVPANLVVSAAYDTLAGHLGHHMPHMRELPQITTVCIIRSPTNPVVA